MITLAQRRELLILHTEVETALGLMYHTNAGHTNHGRREVVENLDAARLSYINFLDTLTEQTMAYDDMSQYETQEQRLGTGRAATSPSNPSFQLKATTQTYELSVPELQKLFAKELCVPEDRVTLHAYMQEGQEGPGVFAFAGLKVSVKRF